MARREWEREVSGADQNGTGKGRRGKCRCPPDRAVRIDPLGRVKGMGGSWAGRMRCAREGRTDSRRRTWVAPESARMGEGRQSTTGEYGDGRRRRRNRQIPTRRRGWGEKNERLGKTRR